MRYLITFSYDGSKYKGYQKQPGEITVQGELERVLTSLNNNVETRVTASGRTDAGVHALNQKAHFDLDIDITPEKLEHALNSMLPKSIYIKDVKEVDNDFHARFNVIKKEYVYKINVGEYNPLMVEYIYQYNNQLDIGLMNQAIKYLEGTHDFKSFTKDSEGKEDFVRTIIKTNLTIKDDIISISFVGTGFLRYMVRNMVGFLIEVGRHKRSPEEVQEVLLAKDRCKAGITANPEGLYLKEVYYK